MSIRRFNFVNRKRIRRADARITLHEPPGQAASFEAVLKLEPYKLPPDARVFVEAYRQMSWMRFPFGTISAIQPAPDRRLDIFGSPEGVLFRVRVTATSGQSGLLLAEAAPIHPRRRDKDGDRIPLLPVKPDPDLQQEVWRLDLDNEPLLLVNARIGDCAGVASSPYFTALVYPTALREVLWDILIIHEHRHMEDDTWQSRWIRFASTLPGMTDLPAGGGTDELSDWIREAVAAFSRAHRLYDAFENAWTGRPS